MDAERWQQVARVFHAAQERPAAERAAFLVSACGTDEELRREVESLLAHADSGSGALDGPAADVAARLIRPIHASEMPGLRFGVYELQALIGAGGMGEVYRARDTRLGRDVALKILPPAAAHDPARSARFEREAQVLAALNHPHIAAIYGVEEAGAIKALVMEIVEGDDLSARLARGPLPVHDALIAARQIADALEAAHEQGVVHRDLKPANIRIRRDGVVKLLDFGLAKALAPDSPQSPALTAVPLHPGGTIMGTPAYMSPEQARGEAVGREADIWAFGVVLYELLTGVSPFARQSTAETLAGVLGSEPDVTLLPATTPAEARRLVRRCLERDRTRRLQHMGDARIEVEEALASLTGGATPTVTDPPTRVWRSWHIAAGVVLLALAGLTGWLAAARFTGAPPAGVIWLAIPSLERPSYGAYGSRHVAIAADGGRVAYASDNRLWLRRIGRSDAIAIEVSASDPFFSPDGEWVGFFVAAGAAAGLKKVPADGGPVVSLFTTADRPLGGTWRADGTIVFATTSGLYEISDRGGEPRLLARPEQGGKVRGYAWPQYLPDGQAVLVTILAHEAMDRAQIALLDLATRRFTTLIEGGSAARYASTGHLVYASANTLKAVVFDAGARRTHGNPVTLPRVEVANALDNGAAEFALSATGTLLFIARDAVGQGQRTLSWIDRQGREEPLPLAPGRYQYPRVSPDGTRIALDVAGTSRDIWIWNLARPGLTRVTRGPTEDMLPEWSRDGRRIFFASDRAGTFDVYSQAADGAGADRVEFAGPGFQVPVGVTADGARVLVVENYQDLSFLQLAAPQRLEPLLHGPFTEQLGAVSPDGKWIAYESNESGDRVDIFLRPLADLGRRREKVSIDGGRYPMWDPMGGGTLFYVDPGGAMIAAPVTLSPELRLGRVRKLFDWEPPPARITGRRYDVSPADGRFILTRPSGRASTTIDISVVLNWFEELREHAPAPAR